MPLWGLAIGAAGGVLKNELVDKPAADKKRKYEAETARWSPWTGLKSEPVATPSDFGAAIGFGASGAQIGASVNESNARKNFLDRQGNLGAPMNPADANGIADMKSTPAADYFSGDQKPQTPWSTPKSMVGTLPGAPQDAWFYGSNPSPQAQPMFGAGPNATDSYRTLYSNNVNPDAPYQNWWNK